MSVGWTAAFLRLPLLQNAGEYAFGVYLFQIRLQHMLGLNDPVHATDTSLVSLGNAVFVPLLYILVMLYTHLLEAPLVLWVRSHIEACLESMSKPTSRPAPGEPKDVANKV